MNPKYTKTIVCLANSRKDSGRCIAGKEIENGRMGNWIRPVSKRPAGELSEEERRFEDGQDPKLFDIVRIPMTEPRPHGFQTENHLIDENYYWSRNGSAAWGELNAALDPVKGVLWDNSSSGFNGLHDRVEENVANRLQSSLMLIEVKDLSLSVVIEGVAFGHGKRKVRGRFSLNGAQYLLAVTDPVVERQYLASKDGEYRIGRAVLCISLGEPYKGHAYKLIAGVFTRP